MDFEDQLKKAITRGQEQGSLRKTNEEQKTLSEEFLKNRHAEFRLAMSEHIETCVKPLCDHFPGFQFETIYGTRGWGGAVYREDITRGKTGKSGSFYSRLEIYVRSANEFNVLNIAGKGTIQDKEYFNWNFFKDIPEVDIAEFKEHVDAWILVFAEKFASI